MNVRAATPEDYPHFARLFPELGVLEGVPTEEEWARLHRESVIAELDGEVAGYGLYRAFAEVGHVVHVVTAPGFRRRGVGKALMEAMRERIAQAGSPEWLLNVKPDNAGAIRLYESFGMTPRHRSVQLQINWKDVERLPYAELPPAETDDATIEKTFGLVKGVLGNLRSRGYVLVAFGQGPQAFAAFDSHMPGSHPFRVTEVVYARPLLEALKPYARHDFIRVLVENRPDLANALRAAGATVTLEILQMRGPIRIESIQPD